MNKQEIENKIIAAEKELQLAKEALRDLKDTKFQLKEIVVDFKFCYNGCEDRYLAYSFNKKEYVIAGQGHSTFSLQGQFYSREEMLSHLNSCPYYSKEND